MDHESVISILLYGTSTPPMGASLKGKIKTATPAVGTTANHLQRAHVNLQDASSDTCSVTSSSVSCIFYQPFEQGELLGDLLGDEGASFVNDELASCTANNNLALLAENRKQAAMLAAQRALANQQKKRPYKYVSVHPLAPQPLAQPSDHLSDQPSPLLHSKSTDLLEEWAAAAAAHQSTSAFPYSSSCKQEEGGVGSICEWERSTSISPTASSSSCLSTSFSASLSASLSACAPPSALHSDMQPSIETLPSTEESVKPRVHEDPPPELVMDTLVSSLDSLDMLESTDGGAKEKCIIKGK